MNKITVKINDNIKTKIMNFTLWILLIIVIVFMYYGYVESKVDYDRLYDIIYGKVIAKEFEKYDITCRDFENGLDSYCSETMYKLKNTYEYKIKEKIYKNHFYNDENYDYDKKITLEELKELDKKYTKNYPLKIYYLKNNHSVSCVNLDTQQAKNSRFYYGIAFIFFIILLLVMSFNNFYI